MIKIKKIISFFSEFKKNNYKWNGRCKKTKVDNLYKFFFQKYRTIKKLGEGSFGKDHKAEYKKYIKPKLKIKLETQSFWKWSKNMNYLKSLKIKKNSKYRMNHLEQVENIIF